MLRGAKDLRRGPVLHVMAVGKDVDRGRHVPRDCAADRDAGVSSKVQLQIPLLERPSPRGRTSRGGGGRRPRGSARRGGRSSGMEVGYGVGRGRPKPRQRQAMLPCRLRRSQAQVAQQARDSVRAWSGHSVPGPLRGHPAPTPVSGASRQRESHFAAIVAGKGAGSLLGRCERPLASPGPCDGQRANVPCALAARRPRRSPQRSARPHRATDTWASASRCRRRSLHRGNHASSDGLGPRAQLSRVVLNETRARENATGRRQTFEKGKGCR